MRVFANNVKTSLSADLAQAGITMTINDATAPWVNPPTPDASTPSTLVLTDSTTSPTKFEIISYTGISDNGDGTADITGLVRGIDGTSDVAWSTGDKVYQTFTAQDFARTDLTVADASTATGELQRMLDLADAAGGGTIRVAAGTHTITATLTIGSDTRLVLESGAIMQRGNTVDCMIRNKGGALGGYADNTRITISGGEWDANGTLYNDACDIIAFSHAADVVIRDTKIHNLHYGTGVHLCGCQSTKVKRVMFATQDQTATAKGQFIRITHADGAGTYSWSGPYDDTACEDISIVDSTFEDGHRAVRTDTSGTGVQHVKVRIADCAIDDMDTAAIVATNWCDSLISRVRATGVSDGFLIETAAGETCHRFSVLGCSISEDATYSPDYGIRVLANSTGGFTSFIITDTRINGALFNGIECRDVDNLIVSHNAILDSARAGIDVAHGEKISVQNNHVETTGTYYTPVDDIRVGEATGLNSDTTEVLVIGNHGEGGIHILDKVDICINTQNLMDVHNTVDAGATKTQKYSNFVAAAWVA